MIMYALEKYVSAMQAYMHYYRPTASTVSLLLLQRYTGKSQCLTMVSTKGWIWVAEVGDRLHFFINICNKIVIRNINFYLNNCHCYLVELLIDCWIDSPWKSFLYPTLLLLFYCNRMIGSTFTQQTFELRWCNNAIVMLVRTNEW